MATLTCVIATVPGILSKAIIIVKVNNVDENTLIDTGSSNSLINKEFVQIHKKISYPKMGSYFWQQIPSFIKIKRLCSC
ncbi:unnamed protein product [Macrosiphum euphorbiae]|uniref:Retropepsins domain-containing protein n=1 Tax=Macrosiphum euphorbiae TaxID=13131 RepID=A0AAV0X3Y5_9HEMI|nr:unnamed protein product [Macrosiphum euphorbiae]